MRLDAAFVLYGLKKLNRIIEVLEMNQWEKIIDINDETSLMLLLLVLSWAKVVMRKNKNSYFLLNSDNKVQ